MHLEPGEYRDGLEKLNHFSTNEEHAPLEVIFDSTCVAVSI